MRASQRLIGLISSVGIQVSLLLKILVLANGLFIAILYGQGKGQALNLVTPSRSPNFHSEFTCLPNSLGAAQIIPLHKHQLPRLRYVFSLHLMRRLGEYKTTLGQTIKGTSRMLIGRMHVKFYLIRETEDPLRNQ